jgi:Na+-driven multidrug efflux pump
MLVISIGGIGQFLISTSSWIIVMRIVALYGSAAIAAYTVALRLLEFVWLPAWGLGNAAATLVGQNLGAGEPVRAEKSGWRAARYNTVFMIGVCALFLVFAPAISRLFSSDPEVIHIATNCLRIMGLGLPLAAVGMIISQALNGAGDTTTPTLMNLACFWLTQIPLAYWLAEFVAMGPNGVFIAMVVAEILLTILGIVVFKRGSWKLRVA